MREILIISGKGGTGKTSLSAAFAHLASRHVICDLDVDTPDLHLLLRPVIQHTCQFYSGAEARIDPEQCDRCGLCREMCQFGAIEPGGAAPSVNSLKCEGCKVCVHFCPVGAISFPAKHCGTWFESLTRFGPMVHAQLFPGEENSGRLVALLRQKAQQIGTTREKQLIIADGAPGVGCPVISSLSGVDLAAIVTEPTPSGRHDMQRLVDLCRHFNIPMAVIINKCSLNRKLSVQIRAQCLAQGLPVVAEIPYDRVFVEAMVRGQTVTEFADNPIAPIIRKAWDEIIARAGVVADTAAV